MHRGNSGRTTHPGHPRLPFEPEWVLHSPEVLQRLGSEEPGDAKQQDHPPESQARGRHLL